MTTKSSKTPGKLRKPTNILKGHHPQPKVIKPTPLVTKKAAAPNVALERKLAYTVVENERLQKLADKLQIDLKKICTDAAIKEQEHDMASQIALMTKNQLIDQRNITLMLEKKAASQRAHQATEQTKLLQKVRSLMLSTKAKRVGATQTDIWSERGLMEEVETQTMEELTKEKKMLRDSDHLLTAFITELEREKLAAQNDLKFSLVQIEQRMKEDNLFQLRRAQEVSESRLEQVTRQSSEQIRSLQTDHDIEKGKMESRIEEMMKEIEVLREANDSLSRRLDESQEKLREQAEHLGKTDAQAEITRTELVKLREFKRNVQHDAHRVLEMRTELTKFKDINEIILKEFGKLEEERDGLIAELERGIRSLGALNGARNGKINSKAARLKDLIKINA